MPPRVKDKTINQTDRETTTDAPVQNIYASAIKNQTPSRNKHPTIQFALLRVLLTLTFDLITLLK
jgi:hypothetical protein